MPEPNTNQDQQAQATAGAGPAGARAPGLPPGDHPARPGRGPHRERGDAFPAGAQRLSPYRSCQIHLPELRHRPPVRRTVQSAHGRHQPHQGGRGVRRLHHRGRKVAHRRLGGPVPGPQTGGRARGEMGARRAARTTTSPLSCLRRAAVRPWSRSTPPTTSSLSTSTHWSWFARAKPMSATTRPKRSTRCAARPTGRGRRAPTENARWRKTSTCSSGCAPVSSLTAPARSAPRST